jgi:hypothetical protein
VLTQLYPFPKYRESGGITVLIVIKTLKLLVVRQQAELNGLSRRLSGGNTVRP